LCPANPRGRPGDTSGDLLTPWAPRRTVRSGFPQGQQRYRSRRAAPPRSCRPVTVG